MNKKVCFVTDSIASIGGRQRINAVVCNALASEKDVDVSVLFTAKDSVSHTYAYQLDEKVNILWDKEIAERSSLEKIYKAFRYASRKSPIEWSTKILQRIYFPPEEIRTYDKFFSENKFDVLIGVGTRAGAVLSLISCDARKVVWLHNSYGVYFEKKEYFQWRQDKLYKLLLPKLDEIIVLTDGDVQIYHEKFGKLPRRIYNPLSFQCQKKASLKRNIILFVGRLDYKLKGMDLLLKSMAKIQKQVPDVVLTVVGDGSGERDFLREAEKIGVIDGINMIGSTSDVVSYYLDSSVVVLPSRQEGFGLVVTEAMECGVPVVSYKTEGPKEIIQDGENGFLIENYDYVQFANKVIQLLLDYDLRTRMGNNAAIRARDFSIDVIKHEWKDMLETDWI